jgi:hypothetical protein
MDWAGVEAGSVGESVFSDMLKKMKVNFSDSYRHL